MSEENVEIARRLFEVFQEAFKRGDPAAVFDSPCLLPMPSGFPSRESGCPYTAVARDSANS